MSLGAGLWLVGYVRFVRLLRERQPADDASQAAWRGLLADAGVKRSIPLSVSEQFGPMLCCLPRGYELIVPAELWSELDGAGQGAILRHELAHYQRGDVWKSLLVRLLALPHWFNPVAWLAVRRFEEAAEWACDRAAVADEPATEYAKLLVQLGQSPHALGYGSAAHGRPLAGRVRRVLAGKEPKDSVVKTLLLLVVAVAIVATSVVQLELIAKEPAADAKSEPKKEAKQKKSKAEPRDEAFPPVVPGKPVDLHELEEARIAEGAGHGRIARADGQTGGSGIRNPFSSIRGSNRYDAVGLQLVVALDASCRSRPLRIRTERIAAVQGHVDRMAAAAKDGLNFCTRSAHAEAKQRTYAAANFYLSEAKRHLAEMEAQPAARAGRLSEAVSVDHEMQAVDLEIKLAELRGELRTDRNRTEYRRKLGNQTAAHPDDRKPGAILRRNLRGRKANCRIESQARHAQAANRSARKEARAAQATRQAPGDRRR